jgi:hypothetical protein
LNVKSRVAVQLTIEVRDRRSNLIGTQAWTRPPQRTMLLSSFLTFVTLAPLAALAGTPGALRSLSGKVYSNHLKRTDEPFPVRLAYAKKGATAVPRTLLEPSTPIRRAGVLVASRQLSCGTGNSLCPDGGDCCPTGAECCTQVVMCSSSYSRVKPCLTLKFLGCTGGSCCGTSCCENNGVCW